MSTFHKCSLFALMLVVAIMATEWNNFRIWGSSGVWSAANDLRITGVECHAPKRSRAKTNCTVAYAPVGGGREQYYSMNLLNENDRPQRMMRLKEDPDFVAPDLAIRDLPQRKRQLIIEVVAMAVVTLAMSVWIGLRYGWIQLALRGLTQPKPAPTPEPRRPREVAKPVIQRRRTDGFGRRGI